MTIFGPGSREQEELEEMMTRDWNRRCVSVLRTGGGWSRCGAGSDEDRRRVGSGGGRLCGRRTAAAAAVDERRRRPVTGTAAGVGVGHGGRSRWWWCPVPGSAPRLPPRRLPRHWYLLVPASGTG